MAFTVVGMVDRPVYNMPLFKDILARLQTFRQLSLIKQLKKDENLLN